MSKELKSIPAEPTTVTELKAAGSEDACEIIETTIEDLELLARAFNLISEVCQVKTPSERSFDRVPPKTVIN